MSQLRQAAMTVVFGRHAEELDYTFTSFAQNPGWELHAFVVADALPKNRVPGIEYHLKAPDPSFSHLMRDADFRRWIFLDELGVDHVLVVDGHDALCLQPLPPIPALLRGGGVAGAVEHLGGRYLENGLYTSNFLNAGVTFWHAPSTRDLRQEILERGRQRYRNLIDDQLSLNEVLHCRYPDRLTILPCQFNYRAHLAPLRIRGWPTVPHVDGVYIYHNSRCIREVKASLPIKSRAELPDLPRDEPGVLGKQAQNWRRLQQRLRPHIVK